MPGDHTDVPDLQSDPESSDRQRLQLLASSCHVPVLRMFLVSLFFELGIPLAGAEAHIVAPAGTHGAVSDGDVAIWDKIGQEFVEAYIDLVPEPLRSLAKPFCAFFDAPDSNWNAFRDWRRGRGLAVRGFWQPDLREHAPIGQTSAVSEVQAGAHNAARGWPRLIPRGFSQLGHWEAAHELKRHPLDLEDALPDELQFCIDHIVELGPKVRGMRAHLLQHFRHRRNQLDPLAQVAREINA